MTYDAQENTELQVELGTTVTTYEPYTGGKPSPSPEYPQEIKNSGKWNEEKQKYEVDVKITNAEQNWSKEQTLTLTSDRPLTKWDRLVEQGGEIGWLYGSEILQFTDAEGFKFFHNAQNKAVVNVLKAIDPDYSDSFSVNNSYCTHFINNIQAYYDSGDTCSFTLSTRDGNCLYFKFGSTSDISDLEKFEKWILEKRPVVIYKTKDLQFIPLPQSEQNAIRALKTYYSTTVITVDGGELDPDIKVTYRKEI